jgi:hypothetical protein
LSCFCKIELLLHLITFWLSSFSLAVHHRYRKRRERRRGPGEKAGKSQLLTETQYI